MPKPNEPSPVPVPEQRPPHGAPSPGQPQPLVRSVNTKLGLQSPSSTARRAAHLSGSAAGEREQDPYALDMTHTWNQKPKVEVLFDKPLTVVTNQGRALFGNTQRIVPLESPPRCAQPVDDDAVTQVFRPEAAAARFHGNSTEKLPRPPPGSRPPESNQTQLIRPTTIVKLELPQVTRSSVRDELNKTQIMPQAARSGLGAAQTGSRSVLATATQAAPVVSPASAASATEVASRPTQAAASLALDRTLALRHVTIPLAEPAEQRLASLPFGALDLGVTQVLPVEQLLARRNQAQGSEHSMVEQKEPSRVELRQLHVAESVMNRWRKLPRLTRSTFALALVGAPLWGANAECGSRPEAPVVARVIPNQAQDAIERAGGIERRFGATAREAAPLPPIGPRSTMERTAVDACAEGRYDVAIRLYDALATAHPENPVYGEAARILSDRVREP